MEYTRTYGLEEKATVYSIITDRITSLLKEGTIPWRKPWKGGAEGLPMNALNKRPYRGVNVWLLHGQCYSSNLWLTFNQCSKMKGKVIKGERSTPVVFWNWKEILDKETNKVKNIPFVRYYNVFNVEQCEGPDIDALKPEIPDVSNWKPIERANQIIDLYAGRPELRELGGRAFYSPLYDRVTMPPRGSFENAEEFYSTLFHEYVHSTGHANRLDREGITANHYFGDATYSREELCAEMGAAYLSGLAGFGEITIKNSAAHIQAWLSALKNNPKWLVQAAAQAQKAADYVIGKRYEEEERKAA
jgi:antirestriction protein ArdC